MLLLCLAEALLRIPDALTADRLIAGTIGSGDWARHLGHSSSLLVNASTYGLMLTGRVDRLGRGRRRQPWQYGPAPDRDKRRAGDPPGAAPGDAHPRRPIRAWPDHRAGARQAEDEARAGYRFSFDMLGEAARTSEDAERYAVALSRCGRGHRGMGRASARAERRGAAAPGPVCRSSCRLCTHVTSHRKKRASRAELLPRLKELASRCGKPGCRSPSTPRSKTSSISALGSSSPC